LAFATDKKQKQFMIFSPSSPVTSPTLSEGYLTGQLLIAMPNMQDPRFHKTVVFVCVHNEDGAMGIILNRLVSGMSFNEIIKQLDLGATITAKDRPLHFGGPVEGGRGFVLHSLDYSNKETLKVNDTIGLTATLDILKDMAEDNGPKQAILSLGYAGWSPNQLETELRHNGWLTVAADTTLVFDARLDKKWDAAFAKLGISPEMLSSDGGSA
jgi:putative transcriptional regulator